MNLAEVDNVKFTFKKEPRETGLASVGHPNQDVQIKLKKKQVGYIVSPNWTTQDNKWGVRFMIKDANVKCGWRWVSLKARFDSEDEARDFIQTHAEAIFRKHELYHLED